MKKLLIILFLLIGSTAHSQTIYYVYKVTEASVAPNKSLKWLETDADMPLMFNGNYIEVDNRLFNVDQSTLKADAINNYTLLTFQAVDDKNVKCQIVLGTNSRIPEYYITVIYYSHIIRYYYK